MSFVNTKLENFNNWIKNKKVAIIGLGVSNTPLIEYMYKLQADLTVFDNRPEEKIDEKILAILEKYNIKKQFGENYLSNLKDFDIIFKSPSCRPDLPEIEAEVKRGAKLTSEIELVLEFAPCKVIAVTGSDGKTTTTSLIYEILKNKYKCYLGGNIGFPLFTKIGEMKPEDIIILELSSFQLMTMKTSPNIAVVTNVTPNHLDIHKSYEEYINAKANIFENQSEKDVLILNYDNEITKKFAKHAKGKVVFFSVKEKLKNGVIYDDGIIKIAEDELRRHVLKLKDTKLRGIHNAANICAAIAATREQVEIEDQVTAIKNFEGVKHRLEFVREIDGSKWYNDSIASSPTRTIAGLNSFDEEIVLIAGGYDKHLDYEPIAEPILNKVKTLILMGQTAEKIYGVVTKKQSEQNKKIDIYKVKTLEKAIQKAKEHAKPKQIVLFSPASASFDMFKNFEERGNKFKELVKKL